MSGVPLWGVLALGLGLIVVSGASVAFEIALLAVGRGPIEAAAEEGDRRAVRAVTRLADLPATLTAVQLVVTACALTLGAAVLAPAIAAARVPLVAALTALPAPVASGVAVLAGTVVVAVVVLLLVVAGEIVPRDLALARPEPVTLALTGPVSALVRPVRPLARLVRGAVTGLVRLARVEPVDEHQLVHTPAELALAVAESEDLGTITAQDARVIGAALRLAEIEASSAMTPRVDLVAVSRDATPEQVLTLADETGHTRFPVHAGDVDHVVGVVHVKQLLTARTPPTTVAALLRPLRSVPGDRDLESLLAQMLRDGDHAALVVDEYGGTAGLLTLEDVLEELVGDIEDEFDEDEAVRLREDRSWVVPGTFRRDELARLTGLALPEVDSEAETVSGFLTEQHGRLLVAGDAWVDDDGWRLRVLGLEGRRAGEIEVRAPETTSPPDAAGTAGAGERPATSTG